MICNEEVAQMIADCQKRRAKMSEWERDFMQVISKKSADKLTEKQIDRLNLIWDKVTS